MGHSSEAELFCFESFQDGVGPTLFTEFIRELPTSRPLRAIGSRPILLFLWEPDCTQFTVTGELQAFVSCLPEGSAVSVVGVNANRAVYSWLGTEATSGSALVTSSVDKQRRSATGTVDSLFKAFQTFATTIHLLGDPLIVLVSGMQQENIPVGSHAAYFVQNAILFARQRSTTPMVVTGRLHEPLRTLLTSGVLETGLPIPPAITFLDNPVDALAYVLDSLSNEVRRASLLPMALEIYCAKSMTKLASQLNLDNVTISIVCSYWAPWSEARTKDPTTQPLNHEQQCGPVRCRTNMLAPLGQRNAIVDRTQHDDVRHVVPDQYQQDISSVLPSGDMRFLQNSFGFHPILCTYDNNGTRLHNIHAPVFHINCFLPIHMSVEEFSTTARCLVDATASDTWLLWSIREGRWLLCERCHLPHTWFTVSPLNQYNAFYPL